MSNLTPNDMNSFLEKITNTTDQKMKLFICSKLLTYLADWDNSIVCSDIGLFIDTLVSWLRSSNHKLIQIDLDILTELVNRMRADFHPYLTTLVPPLVDKLGDGSETIRDKALNLFRKLVECDVVGLQNLFDKISVACFTHKNSNVREQIMRLLTLVLDDYGPSSLSISKLTPHIVKLLSDPNVDVRGKAMDTLCHVYKHVGERLRLDLQKKYAIPQNKLSILTERFDTIKATADDSLSHVFQSLKVEDETDQSDKSSMKSHNSVYASRPPITPSGLGLSSLSSKSKLASFRKPNGTSNQAGAIDEDTFLASFEDVPTVQLFSCRDLEENLRKYQHIIENVNEDWSKRVDSLKKIRSLIVAGGLNYEEEFCFNLNSMLPSFNTSLKDLRSQVVREACLTVAYLSKCLGLKLAHFAESVLNSLINLIQNSAKVIASSGLLCIRFILQHTHAPRLIPIIANNLNSKSKEIRKSCCEFILLILQTWPTNSLERQASNIQEAIKKGIADADADARAHSRNAYREFSNHFPDLGESLKNSLDYPYRKLLNSNSNSGSSTSLSRIPAVTSISVRSNSAIDLQAVKRAKTRAHYAAMARQKFGTSSVSTARTKTTLSTPQSNDQRVGRTKSRISISQPTSRSGSPSSRLSYTNYLCNSGSISRSSKRNLKPTSAQKILQQSREAETELAATLGSPSTYSFKLSRGQDDHSDESETSSMCSDHSFDSYRRPSDTRSWNGSQHRLYRENREPALTEIGEIIAYLESPHWNERREGLESLRGYLHEEGNKLERSELIRVMDVFTKNFNNPQIRVFSLFLDSLNEVICKHHEDLCYCLHLLLTRLFNKLGTDSLNSVLSKIMRTLDIVFPLFPAELQLQSVFRFLADPTQTPNWRVKEAALNYIIKLTTVVEPCNAFGSTNAIDSSKDYPTKALEKMVSWATADSSKEVRRVARKAVCELFNRNPSQVTRRFSTMPTDLQEVAETICLNRSFGSDANDYSRSSDTLDTSTPNSLYNVSGSGSIPRTRYALEREHLTPYDNGISSVEKDRTIAEYQIKDNDLLKTYIEELSQCPPENIPRRRELLNKITTVVQSSPSDVIISNFNPLLLNICKLLVPEESPTVKELSFNLLQIIAKRKTVTFLLKNISDLVITKSIAFARDSSKDVVKAAENCAISLATFLPAELVIRVVVPLITSEEAPAKLVAIKMLTRTVECSDGAIAMAEIDHIMNALLAAYNDDESPIRKAAVFCMVALHKQSEEMKACLEPYFNRLQGAKLKLLQLYIRRAEQGSSIPTSPKNQ